MDREAVRWGSGAWLALRLVSLVAALSTGILSPGPDPAVPGYQPPALTGVAEAVAGPWMRADALWYLKAATQGYGEDGTLAFFPAFPMAVRVLSPVFGNEAIAGLVVANLASWIGLILLFEFVKRLLDSTAARVAVFGAALFPTAFFFVAPYGESMLLAAGSGALLLSIKGRPAAAALAGAAAALSRPFGAAIALPLAALAMQSRDRERWLAPAGPVLGLAAWGVYAWRLTGNPRALIDIQGNWAREFTPVWSTLASGFTEWRRWSATELGPYMLFDLASTVFGLALVVMVVLAVRWHLPKSLAGYGLAAYGLAAYGLAALAVPLSFPFPPRPMMSNPRFLLALFPLFLGLVLLPARVRVVLAGASAVGLFVGTLVFLTGRPLF